MTKYPRVFIGIIIFFTVLSLLIDLPRGFTWGITDLSIPIINKQINFQKMYEGFKISFFAGNTHIQKQFEFRKGLDLEGGTSITLKAAMNGIAAEKRKDALESAKTVIERRINLYGVSEPIVQTSTVNNDYRIIVELPGVDVTQAVDLIGKTGELSFWENGSSTSARIGNTTALPTGINQLFPNPQKTNLTGRDLQDVAVTFDQNTGKPQVQLVFTSSGGEKFAEITKRNVSKVVAIVLDNQIVEAPQVNEPIIGGNAVISGSFTTEQAKSVSIQLRAGALPVPLSILQQHTVGATLGASSLHKSLFAGVIGFFVIIIFMIAYYGRLGIIASFALVLYTIFTLAIFKAIPITLTLAGIAGFILSIGMAVDANILIFERMKEEIRRGKKQKTALELGFARAWTSIRDSNASTLITSFILYQFGTGIVRGFAITLAIGVIISMISAIAITRTFLRFIYKS